MNTNTSNNPMSTGTNQGKTLGSTFWWVLKVNTRISLSELVQKMTAAGLDPKWARNLAPTYIFTRTVRAVANRELVDCVKWEKDRVSFQISRRVRGCDGIDYDKVAVVSLDRLSGRVMCGDPQIKSIVESEFIKHAVIRRTTDINRMLNQILEEHRNKGIYPMKGGVYFRRESHKKLIDSIINFVNSLGARSYCWTVEEGGATVQQVQVVTVDSLSEIIYGAEEFIAQINKDTGEVKLRNARKKLQEIEQQIKHSRDFLGSQLGRLEDYLAYCETLLGERQTKDKSDVHVPQGLDGQGASEEPQEEYEEECEENPSDWPSSAIVLPKSAPKNWSEPIVGKVDAVPRFDPCLV